MTGDNHSGPASDASAFAHLCGGSPATLETMTETAARALAELEPSPHQVRGIFTVGTPLRQPIGTEGD